MKQLTVRTTQRYNTSAVWQRVNPILLPGEIGIESDSGRFKFGDGVTPWNDLIYAVSEGSLPNVSAANNGSFLRVVNGVWAAATVPNAEETSF